MKGQDVLLGELGEFLKWARSGFIGEPLFKDPTHSRIVDILLCYRRQCAVSKDHKHATAIEFAVVLRQITRRLKDGLFCDFIVTLPDGVDASVLLSVGLVGVPVMGGEVSISCQPWKPKWIDATAVGPAVDDASLCALDVNARARFLSDESHIRADAVFVDATGNVSYRTPGQLAAVRSALSIEPGSTLIIQLPTGGGKTDIAITVLKSEVERHSRTTVLVVPTVALAIDLERRIRNVIHGVWGYGEDVQEMPLRWNGDTTHETRDLIRDRIKTGVQPVIITSPETLSLPSTGVGAALETAAENGLIGWLIIDEAHIIKQWGQDFRPEFLDIAPLRDMLRLRAMNNDHEPLRTLLLSATYTPETLEYLVDKFEGESTIRLVAANELRSEIDIWTDVSQSKEERESRFIEALHRLPRPMIVYATKPDDANRWLKILHENGFYRSSTFTGKTVGKEREDILQKFRNDLGSPSEYDIVIATSAFGLGVDYDQVRSVVHVCIPETVDRWYQEIGRGGRDGYASVSLTLACLQDKLDAQRLGVRFLTEEIAFRRYQTIKNSLRLGSKLEPSWRYLDLHEARMGIEKGSYNRRWNKQVLRGLIDLGIFKQQFTWWRDIPPEDRMMLEEVESDDDTPTEISRIQIQKDPDETTFKKLWEDWRQEELPSEEASIDRFVNALARNESICQLLESVYTDSRSIHRRFGIGSDTLTVRANCGKCPTCRSDQIKRNSEPAVYPAVLWPAYSSDNERRTVRNAAVKISKERLIVINCNDSEISECLQIISHHGAIHIVDTRSTIGNDENLGTWLDSEIQFLMSTPVMTLVILHEGKLPEELMGELPLRMAVNHEITIYLVGSKFNAIPFPKYEQFSFESFKYHNNQQ